MTPAKTKKLTIIIAFLCVYIFWGGTYLGMKIALNSFPPFLMAAIRHTTAGLIMLSIGLYKKEVRPTTLQIRNAAIVGLLLLVGGNGLVAWSEQRLPSSVASLIISSVPFWVMSLNWLGGDKQKPSRIELFSLILGFIGILLMVFQGQVDSNKAIDGLGIFVLLVAAFMWSLGSLYSRHSHMPKSSIFSTSTQMLAGGLSLFVLSTFLAEPTQFDISRVLPSAWFAMFYLIFFGSVIGYTAYIWLMKNVAPSLASTYAFINPVVAVFLGWTLAGEILSSQTLLAAVVIIMAVVILTLSKKPKKAN